MLNSKTRILFSSKKFHRLGFSATSRWISHFSHELYVCGNIISVESSFFSRSHRNRNVTPEDWQVAQTEGKPSLFSKLNQISHIFWEKAFRKLLSERKEENEKKFNIYTPSPPNLDSKFHTMRQKTVEPRVKLRAISSNLPPAHMSGTYLETESTSSVKSLSCFICLRM